MANPYAAPIGMEQSFALIRHTPSLICARKDHLHSVYQIHISPYANHHNPHHIFSNVTLTNRKVNTPINKGISTTPIAVTTITINIFTPYYEVAHPKSQEIKP